MVETIPTYIITGFLGSGKTTILKRMVEHAKESSLKPAILLNELGSENVEKQLFQHDTLIEMLDGCICCTIKDDMRAEIAQLVKSRDDFDILFIEGTGVANPIEIVEALIHPNVTEYIDIHQIISLVDASRFLEFQSLFQSSREIREMLKDQIRTSSLIVLNKIDLIAEKIKDKVHDRINRLKQDQVKIVEATYGDVNLDLLLSKQFTVLEVENSSLSDHHHHPFQALKISLIQPINRRMLEKWLKEQSSLLRAKGYVYFQNDQNLYSCQYSSSQLHVTIVKEDVEPCLILIGAGLSSDLTVEFKETFDV